MKYFCTVSDINYINQGLALYQSLVDNMKEDFLLLYCCIDRETFEHINSFVTHNCNIYPVHAESHKELKNVSETSRQGYAWELGSRFSKWCIDKGNYNHIMYIDSDIITYPGFEKVYDEIGDKSIGIVPHLHLPPAPNQFAPGYPGGYNVGITYFKNNEAGKGCLDLWAYSVLNPYDNEIRTGTTGEKYTIKLHNTCGDQRFLEMFPIAYPNDVHIIGQQIAHGAPWNMHLYNWDDFSMGNRLCKIDLIPGREWIRKLVPSMNEPKPMIYYHFAGFKLTEDGYKETREAFNQDFMRHEAARNLYDEYYQLMKTVKQVYDL